MKIRTLLFGILFFIMPLQSLHAAAVLPPYGGLVTFAIPCTCSFGWLVSYFPLHPITYPWVTHSLVWQAGVSIPYAYQQFLITPTPTSWQLGTFVPGGMCWILAPNPVDPCIPLPADGTIFMAGASFPGFAPF